MQCYVTPVLWNFSCNGQGKATLVGRILKVIHQGAVLGGQSLMSTIALLDLATTPVLLLNLFVQYI